MFCELLCPTLPKDQAIEEKKSLEAQAYQTLINLHVNYEKISIIGQHLFKHDVQTRKFPFQLSQIGCLLKS
jgi:hypothetical protein